MIRLRARYAVPFCRVCEWSSVTSAPPWSRMSRATAVCCAGMTPGSGFASTATVRTPAARAARCAATSMPNASPLTMQSPGTCAASPSTSLLHIVCP